MLRKVLHYTGANNAFSLDRRLPIQWLFLVPFSGTYEPFLLTSFPDSFQQAWVIKTNAELCLFGQSHSGGVSETIVAT